MMLELILAATVVVAFLALVRYLRANVPPGAISEGWAWLFRPGPRGLEKGWYVAAFAVGLLVLLVALNVNAREGEELIFGLTCLLAVASVCLFLRAWRREFVFLMGLRDDVFPGSFDKPIWAVVLVVLPPIGLWCFRSYRLAHWPEPKPETVRDEMAAELS